MRGQRPRPRGLQSRVRESRACFPSRWKSVGDSFDGKDKWYRQPKKADNGEMILP